MGFFFVIYRFFEQLQSLKIYIQVWKVLDLCRVWKDPMLMSENVSHGIWLASTEYNDRCALCWAGKRR